MSVKRATPAASSAEEDKIKANNFNSYFRSVFSTDNNVKIPEISSHVGQGGSLPSLSITAPGIVSLDEKKSSGPDDIPNSFLKRYAEPISRYLQIIFTKSIRDGRLPADWKIAKVVPVHKSGDTSAPSNYRPIFLTCTSCKILEHIILKLITKHVEENNLISPSQHGFRSELSTVVQLVEGSHDFGLAINEQSQIDRVSHSNQ